MSHRLQVLIPEALEERLRKAASRRAISKGELVRRALEAFLEQDRSKRDALDELAALEAPTGDIEEMLDDIERGRNG